MVDQIIIIAGIFQYRWLQPNLHVGVCHDRDKGSDSEPWFYSGLGGGEKKTSTQCSIKIVSQIFCKGWKIVENVNKGMTQNLLQGVKFVSKSFSGGGNCTKIFFQGVDGAFLGPADLSISFGVSTDLGLPKWEINRRKKLEEKKK